MERILQEQIEEQDYQLDDLDDLEEQTIFSPLDDAQIKIFKIGTIVFYLVAYFYTAILYSLKLFTLSQSQSVFYFRLSF